MKTYYYHTPHLDGDHRITVAGVLEGTKLTIGASICEPRDQFIKNAGRQRALGRTKSHSACTVEISENALGKDISNILAEKASVLRGRIATGTRPYLKLD